MSRKESEGLGEDIIEEPEIEVGESESEAHINMANVKEFVRLSNLKAEQERALDNTKELLGNLKRALADEFGAASVQSMRYLNKTVYLARVLWASLDKSNGDEATFKILRDRGLGDMIKEGVNSQTLSAWAREREEEYGDLETFREALSEDLRGVLNISEVFEVRCVSARK